MVLRYTNKGASTSPLQIPCGGCGVHGMRKQADGDSVDIYKWPDEAALSEGLQRDTGEWAPYETLRPRVSLRGVALSPPLVAFWGADEFELFPLPSDCPVRSPLPYLRQLVASAPGRGDFKSLLDQSVSCTPHIQQPPMALRVLHALQSHKGLWKAEELRALDLQAKEALESEPPQRSWIAFASDCISCNTSTELGSPAVGEWQWELTITRLHAAFDAAETACSANEGKGPPPRASPIGSGRLPGLQWLQPYRSENNTQLLVASTRFELLLLNTQVRRRGCCLPRGASVASLSCRSRVSVLQCRSSLALHCRYASIRHACAVDSILVFCRAKCCSICCHCVPINSLKTFFLPICKTQHL